MADEEATQAPQEDKAPQEDVKPDIKPEPSHLTLTVVHQVNPATACTTPRRTHGMRPAPCRAPDTSYYAGKRGGPVVRSSHDNKEEGRAPCLGHAVMKATHVHSAGWEQSTIQGEENYRI